MSRLTINKRRQALSVNPEGYNNWTMSNVKQEIETEKTAVILCDMWDTHTSIGAAARVKSMAPKMNSVVCALREKGASIIHAPSDTMAFYSETPARKRILNTPICDMPPEAPHDDPPLPVDTSKSASDTSSIDKTHDNYPWTRQIEDIAIDQDRDVISQDDKEILSYMRHNGLERIILMGVHTGMCILNRPFGIKKMVKRGVDIVLVRDLTDAMYDPATSPYVSHDEGTRLVVEYIEKFWCPTILSRDLI